MPGLSRDASRIRPAVFAELQGRIDALAARGQRLVPLHIGDTYLPPPDGARRALRAIDAGDLALYRYGPTAGLDALRKAVARLVPCDPETDVLIGNGGTHALYCVARAVLDAGDEVILLSPTWPLAPGIFSATGAIPVGVPVTQELFRAPSFDVRAALESRLTPRSRAVYFVSPNNPDGKVLGASAIAAIAEFSRVHDLWVFADEVYAEMMYEGAFTSVRDQPGMHGRTFVLRSLSKSHALAGVRVGFCIGPGAAIAQARRVATHTAFNVSLAMQRVAVAALEDTAFPEQAARTYRASRDAAMRALAGAPVRFHAPEGAAYLFIDFSDAFAARPAVARPLLGILEHAVDRGVLLAPGDAFGDGYGSWARLCFTSVPLPEVTEGIARLCEAVDRWQRG